MGKDKKSKITKENSKITKKSLELNGYKWAVDWDMTREVGGLMLGRIWDSGYVEVCELVQLQNRAVKNLHYKLPVWIICFIKCLPGLLKGNSIIGEWHSHPSGLAKPSSIDTIMALRKAKYAKGGVYTLGILTERVFKSGKSELKLGVWKFKAKGLEVPKVLKVPVWMRMVRGVLKLWRYVMAIFVKKAG